jgi:ADP-heptose:LPS heptosyltransferase
LNLVGKLVRGRSRVLFHFLLACQALALFFFDTLCLFLPKGTAGGPKKKVLIIRLDGIGDFFLWLDSAKELKSLFPSDRYDLVLLGNQLWTSLARQFPYFDQVWDLSPRDFILNLHYRMKMAAQVRQAGFSIVVQPSYSRSFILDDPLVRISGAGERIGFQGDYSNSRPWQKRISDTWYTRIVPATPELRMELIRNADFIRGIGGKDFKSCVATMPLHAVSRQKLPADNYFVLFPGAGVAVRQWPLPRFANIAEKVFLATGWQAVVCGGRADADMGVFLHQQLRIPIHNLVGKTSIEELVSIIHGARILIGNDTSAIHIAAAVATPSIAIFGGGHFGRFLPYQMECLTKRPLPVVVYHPMPCFHCNWNCIYRKTPSDPGYCIEKVTVEMVWTAVHAILGTIASGPIAEG